MRTLTDWGTGLELVDAHSSMKRRRIACEPPVMVIRLLQVSFQPTDPKGSRGNEIPYLILPFVIV